MATTDPSPLRPKTPGTGIASLTIGFVTFLLLGPAIYVLNYGMPFAQQNPFLGLIGILVLIWMVLAGNLLGLILGIIACAYHDTKKKWSALGIGLNTLQLLGVAILLGLGFAKGWGSNHIFQKMLDEPRPSDGISSRPISISSTVKTQAEFARLSRKWRERNMLDAYQKVGSHDERWDKLAVELISQWIKFRLDEPDALRKEDLMSLGQKLLDLNCNDPLIVYCCGVLNNEVPFQIKQFEKALETFKSTSYPKVLPFFASALLISSYKDSKSELPVIQKLYDTSLTLFKETLEDGSYTQEEIPLLLHDFGTDALNALFKRRGESLCKIFESSPIAERWAIHVFWGRHYVDAAWEARGSDYSNTVTERGWKRFYENLSKASVEFTRAWKLNPDRPEAAASMITVEMGLGEENARENMRMWFDRAVTAQFDYGKAYDLFLWGIRPRWIGSHEDMLSFGEQCLNTGRFDTQVPNYYLTAILNVGSELDDPNLLYGDPKICQNLKHLFEGQLKEPSRNQLRNFDRSMCAIMAYKAHQYQDARIQLETINFKLDPKSVDHFKEDLSQMVEKVCAFSGPAQAEIKAGEEDYLHYQTEKALKNYLMAADLAKTDPRSLPWIQHRTTLLELESALNQFEWVPFLPPTNFLGWSIERGDWKILEDGSLEVKASADGMMIKSLARIGPDFEVKGEIEFVSSSNGQYQAGVVFGYPEFKKKHWMSFRVKRTSHEGEVAYFSQHFYAPQKSVKIPILDKNQFHVQSWNNKLTSYLNGQLITENDSPPEGAFVNEPDSLVGFGGFYDQNEFVVRYRNIMIRRLKSAPSIPTNKHEMFL